MRIGTAVLLASLVACSNAPARTKADRVADQIRAGREVPLEELAELAEGAERRHVDALFLVIERDASDERALFAATALAPLLAEEDLPRIEKLIEGEKPSRGLFVIRLSGYGPAGPIMLRHAKRLLSIPSCAKLTVATLAVLRLRAATDAILAYLDAEDSDVEIAFRALGRIWEQRSGEPPLPAEEERVRLKVLLLVHGVTMQAPDAAPVDAMLSVMTAAELDDFLAKHAEDRFRARDALAQAAADPRGDTAKGERVHAALLANPDVELVARILRTSPHKLIVWRLLDDDRAAEDGTTLAELAAARLEGVELPKDAAERAELVKKWRAKKPE